MNDIQETYSELLNMSVGQKALSGQSIYRRIVDTIAYYLKYRNNVLSEKMLLSYIYQLVDVNGGPTFTQWVCIRAISGHEFNYEHELYSFLRDNYQEAGQTFHDFIERKPSLDIINDILYVALMIIEAKNNKEINDKEMELLLFLDIDKK